MDMAAPDDIALVEAVRRGERAGLEGMYRRYADRLYTYARTMLREPEAAADAVHDAFLTASQRIDQLREPDRLRSWLYAIVRNECLRQLRERSRSLPLDEADEPVSDAADPGTGVNAAQVRDLVHTAAAALNPGDREVVHLAIRHDLSSADIGMALGVPANHAHARLSRARSQLERALGALLVARSGGRDCPTLAGLIDGWQGRLTPTLRKRVSRHIESCAACGLLRREQLSPAALLSAYTAPAFLVAADMVWPRLAEAYAAGGPPDAPSDATADAPSDATADPPSDATADAGADPAGAVTTDLAPTTDEPAGSGDTGPVEGRSPADGPVTPDRMSVAPGGPAPAPEHVAVPPDDPMAAPVVTEARDGSAATPEQVAVAPDGAAVRRGAAHTVRTTPPADRGRRRRRMAAGAALLVLLAVLGTWVLASGRPTAGRDGSGQPVSEAIGTPGGDPAAAVPLPSVTVTAAGSRAADPPPPAGAVDPTSGTAAVPGDGDGSARPDAPDAEPGSPPASTRPPAVPRPTGTPQIAAPFTISATAHVRCGSETYSLVVQATGSGTLDGAEVRWTPAGGRTSVRALTVDGSTARVTVGRLRASSLTWSVHATAVDGRTARTPIRTVADPCVRPG
ncbi:sigma-70 family RNA polymerase sigma factor [Micromonospora sp. NPDC047074]|uniref:sigma-70 family RNA polymerase sigma factor n=1 Tax=Micromonospora sp. NPDC047074 TaxID=3154339 RepID=UPI0033CDF0D5